MANGQEIFDFGQINRSKVVYMTSDPDCIKTIHYLPFNKSINC